MRLRRCLFAAAFISSDMQLNTVLCWRAGHVDNMCCFIRPGVVALAWCDNPDDPQVFLSLLNPSATTFTPHAQTYVLLDPSSMVIVVDNDTLQRGRAPHMLMHGCKRCRPSACMHACAQWL
jgi:hypothetical protein